MKTIVFFITLHFFCINILAQDTIPITQKSINNEGFADCYSYKDGIVALTKKGNIYHIKLSDYSFSQVSPSAYSVIGVDRKDRLWAVDSFSSYYALQDTGWHWEGRIGAQKIWQIVFSSKNSPILITSVGVYNRKTEMFYGENGYRGRYRSQFSINGYNLNCSYVDKNDNLWMGANYRIGKEVHVFSIKKNKFITTKLKGFSWFHRVQDIFGNGKEIFLIDLDWSYGMSSIKTYKKDTMRKIHHFEYDTMNFGPSKENEDFIGSGFYNSGKKEIYYFSSFGLLKCKYSPQKGKITKQDVIIPIGKEWNGYEFENSKFATEVKRIFLSKEKIVYLHKEKGIFIFDGSRIINIL